MGGKDPFSDYPHKVRMGMRRPDLFYVRVPGYYAAHNLQSDEPASDAVFVLNEGTIAVFRGEPGMAENIPASAVLSPVYSPETGGPLAVPTGLIFIRFTEGVSAEAHREELHRAGYKVVQILAYAPHSAWLEARSGGIAEALTKIHLLEGLSDVENVEPQILMESARRA